MEGSSEFIPDKWREPFGLEVDLLYNVSPSVRDDLTLERCHEEAQELLDECAEHSPYIGRLVNFLLLHDRDVPPMGLEHAELKVLAMGTHRAKIYGFCYIVDHYADDQPPHYELGIHAGVDLGGAEYVETVIPVSSMKNIELADRNDLFYYEKSLFVQMLPSLNIEYSAKLDDIPRLIAQVEEDDGGSFNLAMNMLNSASRLKNAHVRLIFDQMIEYECVGDHVVEGGIGPMLSNAEGEVVGFTIGFANHPDYITNSRLQLMVLLRDVFEHEDGSIGSNVMVLPIGSLATAEILSSPHNN